jgi:hypothetical protein
MNVSETQKLLTLAWGTRKSVMLRGNHGIGKSAVVKAFQEGQNATDPEPWGFVDIRLSQQDVGDLRGIPFRVNGSTFFAPPLWLPISPEYQVQLDRWMKVAGESYTPFQTHTRGIIFLDEFNRATREVLQCAFELVLDRRLGGVPIPEGWLVVAAINGDEDIYEVARLDAALLNRFILIDFRPTAEDWLAWAKIRVDQGILHTSVYQYLQRMPHKMDPSRGDLIKAAQDSAALFTRRSWTTLGEILAEAERQGQNICEMVTAEEEAFAVELFSGVLGPLQALAFLTFIKTDFKVLNPREVLHHWNKEIEGLVTQLSKSDRPLDLLGLNQGILEELKKILGTLGTVQITSMTHYVYTVPNEVAMDIFTRWVKQNSPQVKHIYDTESERPHLKSFKSRIAEISQRTGTA